MKATLEIAEAVKRLRTSTDFNTVMQGVADYGERLVEQMIYAQDDQLRLMQGKAQAVTEILKAIKTAPEKFSNIQK